MKTMQWFGIVLVLCGGLVAAQTPLVAQTQQPLVSVLVPETQEIQDALYLQLAVKYWQEKDRNSLQRVFAKLSIRGQAMMISKILQDDATRQALSITLREIETMIDQIGQPPPQAGEWDDAQANMLPREIHGQRLVVQALQNEIRRRIETIQADFDSRPVRVERSDFVFREWVIESARLEQMQAALNQAKSVDIELMEIPCFGNVPPEHRETVLQGLKGEEARRLQENISLLASQVEEQTRLVNALRARVDEPMTTWLPDHRKAMIDVVFMQRQLALENSRLEQMEARAAALQTEATSRAE